MKRPDTKRYFIRTFGCQMNVHDSRRIEGLMREQGWEPAEAAGAADLLIVNTCSVREKAAHKLMSYLGTLRPLKQARPEVVLAVVGCLAQQEGERLLRSAPHVDLVLGPDNIAELPSLCSRVSRVGASLVRTQLDLASPRFLTARPRVEARRVAAFVTTMKGCDERCTFCIVPTTRGSERYRRAAEIVDEVRALVDGGVREVTLLGQTVNSWHEPGAPEPGPARGVSAPSRFADLLRTIAHEVPSLERLRYTSPHPRHLTPELVRAHAQLTVLQAHVHLPSQSGSDLVLRRMLRRYTRREYIERALALRGAREGLTLSTDIIVGFPGERESDFEQTLSMVREVGFVSAFAFKYSPRPGTPALALGDDVAEQVKDERLARLFALIEGQQSAHLSSLVGARLRVLVEGLSRQGVGRFTGRSERHEIVHVRVTGGGDPTGTLVEAEVTHANKHSLLAEAVGVPGARRAAPAASGAGRRVHLSVTPPSGAGEVAR